MLDMGFAEDIESILGETPAGRQTVLFSATLPPRIAGIAKRAPQRPGPDQDRRASTVAAAAAQVRQAAYIVPRGHKLGNARPRAGHRRPDLGDRLLPRRNEVDELAETLNARGYRAEACTAG